MRKIALFAHSHRTDLEQTLALFRAEMTRADIALEEHPTASNIGDCELAVVIGGDGTVLKAAEFARPAGVPILGINYGHIGFLSEAEPDDMPIVVSQIAQESWSVDSRMTIDVEVIHPDGSIYRSWALNEVAIEKVPQCRLVELSVGVDGREISSFKTDTVLLATATGSTAYNFSAGGPIVWPNVEAMVLTPVAAHALFTRPLVVAPESTFDVHVTREDAQLWCDSRRFLRAPSGSIIRAYRGHKPVALARLNDTPFSGRLVKKFRLPTKGWRQMAKEEQE